MRFYDRPLDVQSGKALHPIREGGRIASGTMDKIKKITTPNTENRYTPHKEEEAGYHPAQ